MTGYYSIGGGTRLQTSPNVMSFLKILKNRTFGDVSWRTFGDTWRHLETFGDVWRHLIFLKLENFGNFIDMLKLIIFLL